MLENPFTPQKRKTNPEADQQLIGTFLGSEAAAAFGTLTTGEEVPLTPDNTLTLTDEERAVIAEAKERESLWNRERYITWAEAIGKDATWVDNTFTFHADGTVECGDLDLIHLTELSEFPNNLTVHGDLSLANLTTATNLTLPESVGGNLILASLTTATNLTFPESVGGFLYLASLTTATNLTLPESVGGNLNLRSLTIAENLTLPESVGGDLSLANLTTAENLTLPESVGGNLNLENLTTATNLTFPEFVGVGLALDNLTTPDGLIVPNNFSVGKDGRGVSLYIHQNLKPWAEELKKDGKLAGRIEVI